MIEPSESEGISPQEDDEGRFISYVTSQAGQGRSADDLYQDFTRYNREECNSAITEECIQEWVLSVSTAQRMTDPLERAIAIREIKYLYSCVEILAALSPLQYALKKGEIKEAFGKSINLVDLDRAVAAERRKLEGKKIDVADIVLGWCSRHTNTWAYDEDRAVWRMWNSEYWQEQQEDTSPFDLEAVAAIQEAQVPVNSSSVLNLFKRLAPKYLKRVFPHQPNKINFAGGTLNVKTGVCLPFQKEDLLTYCLPYVYNPYGSHPHIDQYLEETIPDLHARQAYITHVGLSLIGDTCLHKFLLLLGPPRSGKSTLLALANALCGIEYTRSFAGDSLFSQELEGKRSRYTWNKRRIVCADEVSIGALRDGEENLKNMSAHSGVEMRGINKDETMDNRWIPKMILAMNDTPSYKDTSGAIGHRAIIIDCPNGPRPESQQDQTLMETALLPEIGAFAATCVRYALAVLERKYYPRSKDMKELLHRITINGNLLKSFVEEKCILEKAARISVSELYTPFVAYNKDFGNDRSMHSSTMASALYDMRVGVTGKRARYGSGHTVQRVLDGIRLRTDQDLPATDDEYTDDPILVNACERLLTPPVNSTNGHAKPVQDTMLTVCTPKLNMNDERGYISPQHIYTPSIGVMEVQNPFTPSTEGMDQPGEQGKDVDTPCQQGVNRVSTEIGGEEETAKRPALKWTEKACDRSGCGSHFLQRQDDGRWLCVCYQQKKEEKKT